MNSTQHISQLIRTAVAHMKDISLVYLFGSAASGRMRPDSDIDIAIAGNTPFSWERLQEIRIELSRALRREIDIIDLTTSRGLIFYQAMTKGNRVVSTDKRLLARLMTDVVYFAADMLPLISQSLEFRANRYIHG